MGPVAELPTLNDVLHQRGNLLGSIQCMHCLGTRTASSAATGRIWALGSRMNRVTCMEITSLAILRVYGHCPVPDGLIAHNLPRVQLESLYLARNTATLADHQTVNNHESDKK